MREATLARTPALSLQPGRYGKRDGTPGLVIEAPDGREIIGIAARRGHAEAVAEAVAARWNLVLPRVPRFVGDDTLAFAWAGPDQWLAHAPGGTGLENELRGVLAGLASLSAQGDGRVVLRVGGPAARRVLATGIPIDLHPRAFSAGHTAITMAIQIGIHIRQLDDAPCYELLAFRSFADSLCGWLIEAGRADGVELRKPGPA